MVNILGTLLAFTIVFGILVFVHEFGHFFMAKLAGVRVEVFSFGYGKRLFGFKKGDTDYRISLLPMGGYVRLLGEGMFEKDRPVAPDDLMAKTRGQRLLIMAMGSIMNIVLAVVIVAFMNGVGTSAPEWLDARPVIGWIESGSPAERAGLRVDDEILRIAGRAVGSWADVQMAIGTKPDRLVPLEVRRDGQVLDVDLQTESVTRYEMGYAGFQAKILTEIRMVLPNSPAEKAGLKAGDLIVAIDGAPVYFYKFLDIIQKNAGRELQITVDRGGRTLTLPVTPRKEGEVGKIGISQVAKSVIKKYPFFAAIGQSFKSNLDNVFLIVRFVKELFTGEASTRQLGGPLEIANFSYAAFRMGWAALLSWIAVISLQLGVLNLFPIPVFDGGQIFVLVIESIFRRDLGPKARQVWMTIGFVIFVFLIVFVILNDIVKRLPNGWGSLVPF
ncbi:MAG: RIP metalloprotease RseP [Candidatus Aminicenantes bacterium]|nr:RIP metalloprotease RseP [Candidatus Aminicenantes bacterium]